MANPRPAPASASRPETYRARIRMYRQGLGDCFLLSFPTGDGKHFHMLIDCGVVLGTGEPAAVMKQVAEDIEAATRDKDGGPARLDVLVITHEHWDHLSGFDAKQARAVFERIAIGALWLAWTEDDTDDLAVSLRQERERKKLAAAKAMTAMRSAKRPRLDSAAQRVAELLGFFGAAAAGDGSGPDDASGGTAGAFAFLKGKCAPTILATGSTVSLPGVEGVRAYVLGPPRDREAMRKANPHQGEGYGLSEAPIGLTEAFLAAFEPTDERAQPFPKDVRRPLARLKTRVSRQQLAPVAGLEGYYQLANEWRNIDDAWLATGERLALQLDNATNNTSLVLAIELPGGDVLLFVGDAQAGNWRSWEACKFQLREKGDTRTVTCADLLKRTIFYKVGHHGSHNATLREKGLELMKSDRLAAVIPVDTAVAHEVKGWKHMPLPAIRERLEQKCAIVFQADKDPLEKRKIPGVHWEDSAAQFEVRMKNKRTRKMQTVRKQPLYTDYFI